MRRRIYAEAASVLVSAGSGVLPTVHAVVILDRQCPVDSLPLLKLGLTALAEHYGLVNARKLAYRKTTSPIRSPVTP